MTISRLPSKHKPLIPHEKIADFSECHQIKRMWLFGSVLRNDFGPESDIDVLVEFEVGAHVTFADLSQMETELQAILGRQVDLGERQSVVEDANYLRRKEILGTAQVIYEK